MHLLGALRVGRAVLPIMRRQQGGYIVNIHRRPDCDPLSAALQRAKFALEGMIEFLRLEVRQFGIRVVPIEPGDTKTRQ